MTTRLLIAPVVVQVPDGGILRCTRPLGPPTPRRRDHVARRPLPRRDERPLPPDRRRSRRRGRSRPVAWLQPTTAWLLRAASWRRASHARRMDLRPLLPAFATHLAARAAADRTRTSYRRSVAAFLKLLPERDATRADIEHFLARPRREGSPRGASTKRAELMALRAFFRFAVAEGVVTDPTAGIRVKRERRAEPAVAMPVDIGPMYGAAMDSAAPARNAAILALLQVFGLRVHELALLDAAQIDLGAGVLRQVRGKGGARAEPSPTSRCHPRLRRSSRRGFASGECSATTKGRSSRPRVLRARPPGASRSARFSAS